MRKFFNEFREFISRGNVMNLAVGVIIGAAFQAIVKSLTDDIISPLLGLFLKKDFSAWSITVGEAHIKYGSFITAVINFLIMAFVIFLLVKAVNKVMELGVKKDLSPSEPTTKKCPFCCSEISLSAKRCPHCTSDLTE